MNVGYERWNPGSLTEPRTVMDSATWSIAAPAIRSAFFASLVEVLEAFTIVLAIGTLRVTDGLFPVPNNALRDRPH